MSFRFLVVLFVLPLLYASAETDPVIDKLHQLSRYMDIGGGYDDGAQSELITHSNTYGPTVIKLLDTAEEQSQEEHTALNAVEMLIDEPGVKAALKRFGCRHSDVEVVDLVSDILAGPVEGTVIIPATKQHPYEVSILLAEQSPIESMSLTKKKLGCR